MTLDNERSVQTRKRRVEKEELKLQRKRAKIQDI